MWDVTFTLLQGFGTTCLIFFLTLVFALPLGLLVAFGSMCKLKIVSRPIKMLIWVIRGTPLILQIFVIFYGPGLLFGWKSLTVAAFNLSLKVSTRRDRYWVCHVHKFLRK